jgi:hypothetical protein
VALPRDDEWWVGHERLLAENALARVRAPEAKDCLRLPARDETVGLGRGRGGEGRRRGRNRVSEDSVGGKADSSLLKPAVRGGRCIVRAESRELYGIGNRGVVLGWYRCCWCWGAAAVSVSVLPMVLG